MRRLYKWQQILSITRTEAVTLAILSGLFILGSTVKHFQSVHVPYDSESYAADDSLLEAGLQSIRQAHSSATDTIRVRADSLTTSDSLSAHQNTPAVSPRTTRAVNQTRSVVPLNINTASARLLQQLPGIGPALAARIIQFRETRGPFKDPSGITGVTGIGPKTFEKLKPYLVVPEEPNGSENTQEESGSDR